MPASAATVSVLADFEGATEAPTGFYAYGGGGGGAGYSVQTVPAGDPLAMDGQTGENNVLSVGADVPAGAYAGFGQNFAAPVDVSTFDGLQFWMYGTGSGAVLQSELLDGAADSAVNSDTSERFDYQITDDWTGWKLVQIPFSAYQLAADYNPAPANGVLDRTELYGFIFPVVSTTGPVTWKVDDLAWFSGAELTPKAGFTSATSSVGEGATTEVTVRLDIASETAVTADWATSDGTATAGEDYTAASGTVTFAPGVTTATVEVVTLQDEVSEGNETFGLTLSGVTGADLGAATHTVTIRDDEVAEAQPVWDNVRPVEGFDTAGPLPMTPDGVTAGYEFFADPTATVSGEVEVPATLPPGDEAGDPSLRLTMQAPSYAGVTHKLGEPGGAWTPQDWSRYDGLSFWFHGTNSGRSLFIDLLDNRNPGSTTDDAERYSVVFTDDSAGWRYVELPFSTFTRKDVGNGAPNDGLNLTAAHGWAIGATAVPTETTWYVEDVALTVPETVIDEYQYADGLPSGTDGSGLGLGFQTYSGNGASVTPAVVTDERTASRPGAEAGNSALGLTLDVPAGSWAGISHAFATEGVWTPQDWSSSQGLNFWLYGQGTGDTVYVDVIENRSEGSTRDDAERYSASVIDDVVGWRFVELAWDDFTRKDIGNGAPNDGLTLDEVHGYAIGVAQTDGATEYLVDRLARWGASLADVPLLVGFDRGVYSGTEGGTATVTVALGRASSDVVTVDYATLEGTDRTQTEAVPTVAGRDYTPTSGTLTFAPGETSKTFPVELLDDDKFELTKNVQVELSDVTGAAELSPFSRFASIAITDDDPRDPNLVEDFETHPGLWRTTGADLTDIRVLAGDPDAYPRQAADEGVGEVTLAGGGAEVRRDFAEAQDWSGQQAMTFWYRGTGSGDPVTVSLRDDAAPDPGPDGWTNVVYRDDFDAAAGTPVDPDSWSNETGGWGWGNQESQFYTPGSENVSQDGEGNLEIELRENTDESLWCSASNVPCGYTSARIATMDKQEFLYGRMEARLKVPSGEGLWPAFWSLGNDFLEVGWPQTGEIDIMEHVEGDNGMPNEAFGTIHGPGYSGGQSIDGRVYLGADESFADAFHTFTVEWEPERITWFMDGVQYHQVTPEDLPGDSEWVFDHPFFLILNMAIGGNFGGTIEDGLALPASFLIDYVQVEQAPDTAERFEASFVDSTAGWRQVTVPFGSFRRSADQPAGAPDNGLTLASVNGFGFTFDEAVTSGTVLLDAIRVGPVQAGPTDPGTPPTTPPTTPGTTTPGAGGSSRGGVLGATGVDLTVGLIALALMLTGGAFVAQARRQGFGAAPLGEVPDI